MITVQAHNTYRVAAVVSAIASRVGVFSFLISNLLLFAACSGSSDGSDEPQRPVDGPSVLNIYVYAPGQAVPTRGNQGQVNADPTAEDAIHTLQIWVYTRETTPTLVTYFKTNAFQQDPQKTDDTYKFELPIDDTFANTPDNESRPKVDVYVLANVTSNNCGLDFDENTSKADLEAAILAEGYFGVATPVTEVPYDGLPMSGKLSEQKVSGNKPVLTLGPSPTDMAKIKLARAVSKARFVFSCSTDFDGLQITGVTFDPTMIPTQEYLFLNQNYTDDGNYIKIGGDYNTDVTPSLFSIDETTICADPAHYAWDRLLNDKSDCTAQDYENLIADGLTIHEGESTPRLTERRLYLRESDKQLSGTIYYKVKEKDAADYGAEQHVPFKMVGPEDPWKPYFSRNHTWIVYAYLAWAKMRIVDVHFKDWVTTQPSDHSLYNW